VPDGPTSGDSTAYETELRQHRRANEATNPRRANLVVAALQDMVMVKTICTKIQNNSFFDELLFSLIDFYAIPVAFICGYTC